MVYLSSSSSSSPPIRMINVQVPELLIYDETQYVVDRLDEVIMMITMVTMIMMVVMIP